MNEDWDNAVCYMQVEDDTAWAEKATYDRKDGQAIGYSGIRVKYLKIFNYET